MFDRVYYIVKSALHYYPPCMSQIKMLQDLGVKVIVLYGSSEQIALDELSKRDIEMHKLTDPRGRFKGKLDKANNWIQFRRTLNQYLKNIDKDNSLLWFGNAETALPMKGLIEGKFHYIVTYLELLDDRPIRIKLLKKISQRATAIVACEITRAYIMKYWFGLKQLPYVIPNKPYELGAMKNSEPSCDLTRPAIDAIRGKNFIIFQGIFQKLDYMKEIAKALADMDTDYYIVLMGFDLYKTNPYEELKKIYDRVILLSSLPAPLHLEVTSHAKMGLVFYEDFSLNQAFCAPNKIYEYSGFGIPMLANQIPGLVNTVGRFDAGKCVEFKKEQLIEAIREIDGNYNQYSMNAQKMYNAVDNKTTIRRIMMDVGVKGN